LILGTLQERFEIREESHADHLAKEQRQQAGDQPQNRD